MITPLDKLKQKNYTFINLPKESQLKDYENALNSFITLTLKRKDILSIYQFGSVKCPGISDIDIALVFKDQNKDGYSFNRQRLAPKTNYLFLHPPSAILNQNLFENLNYLIPTFKIKKVYGQNLKLNRFKKESKKINQAILTDTLFTKYPRLYLNCLFSKKINTRLTLNILNSMNYPILMLKELYKTKNTNWSELLNKIKELRTNWFELNEKIRNKELIDLLRESLIITLEIIEAHNNKLPQNINPKKIVFKDRLLQTIFLQDWKKSLALKKMLEAHRKNKSYSILPLNLGFTLYYYSTINNDLGRYIKQRLNPQNIVNLEQADIQTKRSGLIQEMIDFTIQKKYLHGALTPWDLGYMWHVGFKNKLRDLYHNMLG